MYGPTSGEDKARRRDKYYISEHQFDTAHDHLLAMADWQSDQCAALNQDNHYNNSPQGLYS